MYIMCITLLTIPSYSLRSQDDIPLISGIRSRGSYVTCRHFPLMRTPSLFDCKLSFQERKRHSFVKSVLILCYGHDHIISRGKLYCNILHTRITCEENTMVQLTTGYYVVMPVTQMSTNLTKECLFYI